ncbi:MAG: xanthine dehydrogenase family protein molybdopterin-binding subunit [Armatimonadota bacterium]
MTFAAVGKRVPRLDGPEKVTGRARFGADIRLPNMAFAAVLRSPHAHARIVRLRTDKAEKMPGVLAVITGKDFHDTGGEGGPVLAKDKVRYWGEAIAAVAAESVRAATAAAAAIEVTYAPLPVVNDVREAIKRGAARVHTESEDPDLPNIAGVAAVKRGSIASAFAQSDRVFEATFETPWVHQGFIEPHVSLAAVDPGSGRVTVWTSTQAQFNQRSELASVLGLPMSKLRVVGLPVGGAFGGKIALCVEPIVAELSRRCGRPVKLVVSRKDDFAATHPCGAAVMELKAGAKRDGTLMALQARLLFDTGAYEGAQHGNGASLLQGPYRWTALDIHAYAVYTNKPPAGARRALAAPHVHFAIESMLDIIAAELDIDPLALRLKNAVRAGDPVMGGMPMPDTVAARVIGAAAERAGWRWRRPGTVHGATKARGHGIAAGHWGTWAGGSSATVSVNEDGTVTVLTGAINLTGTHTSFAQIAAESFGIPVDRVNVTQGDTDTGPRNDGAWNSRILFGVGEAVRRACEEAKRKIAEALSEELGAKAADIIFERGSVRAAKGGKRLTFAEAASRATDYSGAIVGSAALSDLDPSCVPVSAQVAEVEVDRETGQVRLLRLVCAQDVGMAINPMSVEGQIEGSASQAMGYTMSEEYLFGSDGVLLNHDLMDFRMPTALDHPQLDVVLIEDRRGSGPFGAKGVGEPGMIPTPAAIANAICDAVGVRCCQLPITPERLVRELGRAPSR